MSAPAPVRQQDGAIDLMVTDLVMARMSGHELVDHSRPLDQPCGCSR
ncbi:MAG TPA: hypothetical protein VHR41_16000 [Gemmatimonadales bacterium]|nr:hypothetical protein [Gemmatimonadales bacterium]